VLAAAFPVSVLSGQVGTLVKLVRVLMLGPVVVFFALRHQRAARAPSAWLTIAAMAALGLGVDLNVIARGAGPSSRPSRDRSCCSSGSAWRSFTASASAEPSPAGRTFSRVPLSCNAPSPEPIPRD